MSSVLRVVSGGLAIGSIGLKRRLKYVFISLFFVFGFSVCHAQQFLYDPECLSFLDIDATLASTKKVRAEKVIFQPLFLPSGDSLTIKAGESIIVGNEVSFLAGSEVVLSIVPCSTPIKQLAVYNFLTPNGDGQNDVFYIEGLEAYPQAELAILNKLGKVIYQASPYTNNWDGGNESKGIYTYHLKLNQSTKPFRGELLLER